jgi:predicted XRE-type DNA-binding protein
MFLSEFEKGGIKLNLGKLKGAIREENVTYAQCAKVLGITQSTFSAKMTGKSEFTLGQFETLTNFLHRTDSQKIEIIQSN